MFLNLGTLVVLEKLAATRSLEGGDFDGTVL